MTIISPVTSTANPASSAGAVANAMNNTDIASNFTTFLQLLTTQLKNQDPIRSVRWTPTSSPSNWWNSRRSSNR